MNIELKKRKLDGLIELVSEVFEDERGFLARIYDERIFKNSGLPTEWTEESHHFTRRKHTLRGLYTQLQPFSEGKLLRVIRGEMLWVSVDVRADSPTFGQWDSIVLSGLRKNMLYTARGFAHGCVSLTDDVDLLIRSDNYFSSKHGIGIIWNDKDLNIDWNLGSVPPFVSEYDSGYSSFKEFKEKYGK